MNRTMIFALVGALATALVVAMLISAVLRPKDKGPVPEILVASRDIPIGARLDTNNARWQKWPQSTSVPGALMRQNVKDVDWQGQKVRRALTKDEPVTQGAMVREIKGSYLAAALEPGMRAIAVETDAASGVAGFLAPGDRVDVIVVMNMRLQSSNESPALQEYVVEKASETILENVRVLATDQDAAGNTAGERKAKVNKTVTLEVDKKGAEKLALAKTMGEIHLALRQLGDETKTSGANNVTTDVQAMTSYQESIRRKELGDRPSALIRVYNGNTVQVLPVSKAPIASDAASGGVR